VGDLMSYLDLERLRALDEHAFQRRRPYPWVNPERLLTEDGYRYLLDSMPDPSLFQRSFGVARAHGQQSHDRLSLDYDRASAISEHWHSFVAELRGKEYGRFLRRLFGPWPLRLRFHWHYTPRGCSVSPHCDAKHKAGSHIFCFNPSEEWDPAWGGQTLILDDRGQFDRGSAPTFDDFDEIVTADIVGNQSVVFRRQGNSWHGVKELHCPVGVYRRVFIVVIERLVGGLRRDVRGLLTGKRLEGY
jgi:hypothetical protein